MIFALTQPLYLYNLQLNYTNYYNQLKVIVNQFVRLTDLRIYLIIDKYRDINQF